MAQPTISTSFASGEWAPKLRSRVDIQKYHAGAALLRNFFVDFAGGGASTRQGTRYINACKAPGARLIPFQPSTSLSYVLEFGQNYIRFYSNGAPILETAVTGGTGCSGDTFTLTNTFSVGDWVFAQDWGGMTNVNGNYFIVSSASGSAVSVTDLFGNSVTFTGTYTSGGQLQRVYTISTPFNAVDLFPNQATGNPGLKFVQDVTSMIICHPNYAPQILTIISVTDWTLTQINFGPPISAPTGVNVTSTLASGSWNYAYLVTAVDANGGESAVSSVATVSNLSYIGQNAGTNTLSWSASSGASSYNVYKALPIFGISIASGTLFGFIGNTAGTSFQDAFPGINPDFSQTPPILQNPFGGASVTSLTLTGNATYTSVPTVTIAPPSQGVQATAIASLGVSSYVWNSGGGGDLTVKVGVNPAGSTLILPGGVVFQITSATFLSSGPVYAAWTINSVALVAIGSITIGSVPSNPVSPTGTSLGNYGPGGDAVTTDTFTLTWNIGSLVLVNGGEGYTSTPSVTISGGATATATVGAISSGNPGLPAFFQERLLLAGQTKNIQSYNLSQPGSFFNFNVSNPTQDDDAISGTIVSEQLNDIRWAIQVPTGVILGTGHGAWLLNGGGGISTMNPITPTNQTANPQAFNGASDLAPQKINFDVIYGTNKGSYFRDLTYNIYANIYTGADISVLSNHLFFGYNFLDVAWSEEPFKTIWFIRNDGVMLSLAFVKDQELIGWAHHDTNGQFKSVCSVIETIPGGNIVDAIYVIVQRNINGAMIQYVERMADRYFPFGYEDSWSVDCALQTAPQNNYAGTGTILSVTGANTIGASVSGSISTGSRTWTLGDAVRVSGGVIKISATVTGATFTGTIVRPIQGINPYTGVMWPTDNWAYWQSVTTVTGLTQLEGMSVVGVADGAAIGPLTVSGTGTVTLSSSASKVTLGLAYLPQLKTLPLDLGEPTVQSKRKKLPAVTLRCADTLGLQVGTSFANVVTMKDLQLGAIPSNSNGPGQSVTDLVNPSWADQVNPDYQPQDARQILDQLWQEPGQICIQQNLPYPATILGVMPEVTVGDTPR